MIGNNQIGGEFGTNLDDFVEQLEIEAAISGGEESSDSVHSKTEDFVGTFRDIYRKDINGGTVDFNSQPKYFEEKLKEKRLELEMKKLRKKQKTIEK